MILTRFYLRYLKSMDLEPPLSFVIFITGEVSHKKDYTFFSIISNESQNLYFMRRISWSWAKNQFIFILRLHHASFLVICSPKEWWWIIIWCFVYSRRWLSYILKTAFVCAVIKSATFVSSCSESHLSDASLVTKYQLFLQPSDLARYNWTRNCFLDQK